MVRKTEAANAALHVGCRTAAAAHMASDRKTGSFTNPGGSAAPTWLTSAAAQYLTENSHTFKSQQYSLNVNWNNGKKMYTFHVFILQTLNLTNKHTFYTNYYYKILFKIYIFNVLKLKSFIGANFKGGCKCTQFINYRWMKFYHKGCQVKI